MVHGRARSAGGGTLGGVIRVSLTPLLAEARGSIGAFASARWPELQLVHLNHVLPTVLVRDGPTRSFPPQLFDHLHTCSWLQLFHRRLLMPLGANVALHLDETHPGRHIRGIIGHQMDDGHLHEALSRLNPRARDAMRLVLIRDQEYRDGMALRLLHEGTEHANNLADLMDMLTMDGDLRRHVVRLLGKLEAT
jgi:hypothetical protein